MKRHYPRPRPSRLPHDVVEDGRLLTSAGISAGIDMALKAGISLACVFRKKAVELPGFFRPTKEWDLLVARDRTLIAAIEAKSQIGPSFFV